MKEKIKRKSDSKDYEKEIINTDDGTFWESEFFKQNLKKISEFLIKHRKKLSIKSYFSSLGVRNIWEKITRFLNIRKNAHKIIIIISVIVATTGISYGAIEYNKTSNLVKEAEQLAKEEKYDGAIEKLELAQNR